MPEKSSKFLGLESIAFADPLGFVRPAILTLANDTGERSAFEQKIEGVQSCPSLKDHACKQE